MSATNGALTSGANSAKSADITNGKTDLTQFIDATRNLEIDMAVLAEDAAKAGSLVQNALAAIQKTATELAAKNEEAQQKEWEVLSLDVEIGRLKEAKELALKQAQAEKAQLEEISRERGVALQMKAETEEALKQKATALTDLEKREKDIRRLVEGKEDTDEKLATEIAAKREQISALQQDLANLKGDVSEQKTTGQRLRSENDELDAERRLLAETNRRLTQAEGDHEADDRKAAQSRKEMEKAELARGYADHRFSEALADAQDAEGVSKYLEGKIRNQRAALAELIFRMTTESRELAEEIKAQKDGARNDLASLADTYKERFADLTAVKAECEAAETEIKRLQEKQKEAEARKATAEAECAAEQAKLVEEVKRGQEAGAQADASENRLKEVTGQVAAAAQQLADKIKAREQAETDRALALAEKEVAGLEADRLRAEQLGIKVDTTQAERDLEAIRAQISAAQHEKTIAIAETQAEKDAASAAKREHSERKRRLTEITASHAAELAEHQKQLANVQAQINSVQEQLLEGAGKIEHDLLEKLRSEIKDLTGQKDALDAEIHTISLKVLDKAKEREDEAAQKILDAEARIARVKEDEKLAHDRLAALQEQINTLDGLSAPEQKKLEGLKAMTAVALNGLGTLSDQFVEIRRRTEDAERKLRETQLKEEIASGHVSTLQDQQARHMRAYNLEKEGYGWKASLLKGGAYFLTGAMGAVSATTANGLTDFTVDPDENVPIRSKNMPHTSEIQRNTVKFYADSFNKNPVATVTGAGLAMLGMFTHAVLAQRKRLQTLIEQRNEEIAARAALNVPPDNLVAASQVHQEKEKIPQVA